MILLENLSKIGLGTYRMSSENNHHHDCLNYAIESGVNLIDTASNYVHGNSERLIGNYINEENRSKLFIISKAGYIQGRDIQTFSSDIKTETCIKISEEFYYSFEKTFLEKQIVASLKRLNTSYLDGFLIHNPEYFLTNIKFEDTMFYAQLRESLIFLETLVQKGIIRYYGISSNTVAKGEINIHKILKSRNDFPNFKLLQFPYNLIENQASIDINDKTLINFCKNNDIKTFANRPLNTKYKNKVLRIADYSNEIVSIDFSKEQDLFDYFLQLVNNQLYKLDEKSKADEFFPIKYFIINRKQIANPEAVDSAVKSHLLPFLEQLQFPDDKIKIVFQLMKYWKLFSKKDNTIRALNLKNEFIRKGEINNNDNRHLSLIACENYLSKGINHVLMGMRKKEYIDKLKPLF